MRFCISRGAAVDHFDALGITPLHWAAMNDLVDAVIVLLEDTESYRELPDCQEKFEKLTPLTLACKHGNNLDTIEDRIRLVRAFLGRGADVEKRDCHSQTVLHRVCVFGLLDVAKLLPDRIYEEGDVTSPHTTPLHLCLKSIQYGESFSPNIFKSRNLNESTYHQLAKLLLVKDVSISRSDDLGGHQLKLQGG
ncbi:ankyrin repeat-containing domain protein [Xylaria cubensis]|nr:ankyrin repeat-containing domain protein [Xylaria cubensis]